MGTLYEVKNSGGKKAFRVIIRKKNFPHIDKRFETKEEAENFLRITEESFLNPLEIPRFPLSFWIERYMKDELKLKTKKMQLSETNYSKYWNDRLGKKVAIDITPIEIELVADELYRIKNSRGVCFSASTRRNYVIFLNFLYKTAIKKWRWAHNNPVEGVDKHTNLINLQQKNEKNRKSEVLPSKLKKSFVCLCEEIIKEKNLSPLKIREITGMSKSVVQNILDTSHNSCIFQLCKFGEALGIKFEVKIG